MKKSTCVLAGLAILRSAIVKRIMAIVIGLALCFSVMGCGAAPEPAVNAWIDAPDDVLVTSVEEIMDIYKTNTVAYNESYYEQTVVIVGDVLRVDVGSDGVPYVILRFSPSTYTKQDVSFAMNSDDGLASISSGDMVAIMGKPTEKGWGALNAYDGVLVGHIQVESE